MITFVIVPRFTPLVIALLSIVFLSYGVYDHYKMFASEYRLSTWQQSLKIYAPAIMIMSIILFIIYAILAFFTKGSVPVPLLPNISEPNENSATNQIIQSLNKLGNAITNNNTNVINEVNNQINNVNKNRNNILGLNTANEINTNKNSRRSFLETI
jgi:biopolymer transport protein ExbD